jgi:diguanylate cyclase (GGDEF)-like protein
VLAHAAARAAEEHALALEKAHQETRAAEEQARLLARHDALTGLPNRRVFSADLQAAISRAQNGGTPCSVLLVDLDDFKKINDLQGHLVGDTVLCEVAQRLAATIRRNDMVARLGGDEFAIIAEGEMDAQEEFEGAKLLASRVIAAIRQPILSGDSRIEIGTSIGIAFCRADATDIGSLLRAADIAMYRAKQSGRNTFRFFDQSMDDEMREKETIERDLIRAVTDGKIQPYYQPLIDIGQNRIRGFEALARWQHPERGFIPPDVFIPIVEQLGLMSNMTMSMLRQACRDATLWPGDICVSVNFSPSELKDPLLPNRIMEILAQEGLAPARLEVEITESALVSDIDAAKAILMTLQGFGVTICLDDFGTGYSSLYHLRELKFDRLKIDRSFVQSMQKNRESEMIVDAILSLTQNLNLPTVAEGIEDSAVQALLAAKGCEYGQGFYFGKPMTGDGALALLKKGVCSLTTIAASKVAMV